MSAADQAVEVRNRQTGETGKVTAKTEDEAALLITQGQFDRT